MQTILKKYIEYYLLLPMFNSQVILSQPMYHNYGLEVGNIEFIWKCFLILNMRINQYIFGDIKDVIYLFKHSK